MTNKRIIWNDHSEPRLRRRGVTREMVRDVLAQGVVGDAYNIEGGERRHAKQMYFGTHELKVVYIERATEREIVTVEWLDYWKE